jgi:hypothetical protein
MTKAAPIRMRFSADRYKFGASGPTHAGSRRISDCLSSQQMIGFATAVEHGEAQYGLRIA